MGDLDVVRFREPRGCPPLLWQGVELSLREVHDLIEAMAHAGPGYGAANAIDIPFEPEEQRSFIDAVAAWLTAQLPSGCAEAITTSNPVRLVIEETRGMTRPWEFLPVGANVNIVRYGGPSQAGLPPDADRSVLRLLPLAVQPEPSTEHAFTRVDVQGDIEAGVVSVLAEHARLPAVVRDGVGPGLGLDEIAELCARGWPSVVHLAAHGSGATLLLSDARGRPVEVEGASLGRALSRAEDLALLTLITCGGAGRFPSRGVSAKLAVDVLNASGVPWLLASRFTLPSEVARDFSAAMYALLAAGIDVEAAVQGARAQCTREGHWLGQGMALYLAHPEQRSGSLGSPLIAGTRTETLGHLTARNCGGWLLEVVQGDAPVRACLMAIGSRLVLGRDHSADFLLPGAQVSRRHCELQAHDSGVTVRDLGSKNGTRIDDRLVGVVPGPVGRGSRIKVGPYELVLAPR